jgi:hypothetical protein
MNLYLRNLFLPAPLVLLSAFAFSQKKDYIVTPQKDTIYGVLRNGIGIGTLRPRLVADSAEYPIKADEIEAYFDSERKELFRSRRLKPKGKPVFIHCLAMGRINLYGYLATTYEPGPGFTPGSGAPMGSPGLPYNQSSVLYAERNAGELVKIKTEGVLPLSQKKRDVFLRLIADNPEVVAIYNENKKMTDADVLYYIHEYNKRAAGK